MKYQKLSMDVYCFLNCLKKNLNLTNRRCFSLSRYNWTDQLTSKRYPHLKRGQFAVLNDSDLNVFEKIIPGRVLNDSLVLDSYNTDWLKIYKGKCICI